MLDEKSMTVGEVFERFRQMPEMRKLLEDCYLDEDLRQSAKRFYTSEEFDEVRKYLLPMKSRAQITVMDLGGGNGIASVACQWEGYRVVLVEPDHSNIVGLGTIAPLVRQGEYNIDLCSAIAENLPFADNTFNIVYTRQVLHHAQNLDTVCAEVYRILKPKGLFLATREHVISQQRDLNIFLNNHPIHRYTGGENAYMLSEYCNSLKRAGFKLTKVLGPWDSVINFYPMSYSQYIEICRNALSKYVGKKIAKRLAVRRLILKLCGWYLNAHNHTPGRLYSFIAVR